MCEIIVKSRLKGFYVSDGTWSSKVEDAQVYSSEYSAYMDLSYESSPPPTDIEAVDKASIH